MHHTSPSPFAKDRDREHNPYPIIHTSVLILHLTDCEPSDFRRLFQPRPATFVLAEIDRFYNPVPIITPPPSFRTRDQRPPIRPEWTCPRCPPLPPLPPPQPRRRYPACSQSSTHPPPPPSTPRPGRPNPQARMPAPASFSSPSPPSSASSWPANISSSTAGWTRS